MAVTGFIGGKPTFYNMLIGGGFAAPEVLCALDAAAMASYSGTGQTWTDLSGNGNSFFRGADNTSEASDPTFNGTAGKRTSDEYWGFDGGDFFTETAAHTFAEPFHKDNALLTICGVAALPNATGTYTLFKTMASGNTGTLFSATLSGTSLTLNLLVRNGAPAVINVSSSAFTITNGDPFFFGVSLDESVGAGGGEFFVNGNSGTFNSTYSSPSSGDSTAAYQLGTGGGVTTLPSGTELYTFAAMNVRASSAQRANLLAKLSKRYTNL